MNVGNGLLGKNHKKAHEKQPDYLGSILVRGERINLAGWKRTAETGKAFLYLVANSKEVANSPEDEFLQAFGGATITEEDIRKVALVERDLLEASEKPVKIGKKSGNR